MSLALREFIEIVNVKNRSVLTLARCKKEKKYTNGHNEYIRPYATILPPPISLQMCRRHRESPPRE